MLLTQAIEDYVRFMHQMDRAPQTIEEYARTLEGLRGYLTNEAPECVDQVELLTFSILFKFLENRAAMAKKPWASATRAGLISELRTFGRYLEQYAELDFLNSKRNPFTNLPRPKVTYRIIPVPEIYDVVQVLRDQYFLRRSSNTGSGNYRYDLTLPYRLWMNERNRLVVFTFCITGIRGGEAARLRWQDVTSRHLHIFGKGDKERIVPLPAELAELFQHFRKLEVERGRGHDQDAVFWGHYKGIEENQANPMPRGNFYQVVEGVFKGRLPGFHNVGPHLLRHAALTALVESGADIVTVASIAGHASIETTFRHYVAPRDRRKAAAIENSPMNAAFDATRQH